MNPELLSILQFSLEAFCVLMLVGLAACFFAD